MQIYFKDLTEWHDWLKANHDSVNSIWMIFYKKHTGVSCISYEDAICEALCFGWIDSLIKKKDEKTYLRKFTPRKDTSNWSHKNIERMRELWESDRMTEWGRAKFPLELLHKKQQRAEIRMPSAFKKALKKNAAACEFFQDLAPSYRRNYLGWIGAAKKETTKQKRIEEAIELLAAGKKLGMK